MSVEEYEGDEPAAELPYGPIAADPPRDPSPPESAAGSIQHESQQIQETPELAIPTKDIASQESNTTAAKQIPELPELPASPANASWADQSMEDDEESDQSGDAASVEASMLSTQTVGLTQPHEFQQVMRRSTKRLAMQKASAKLDNIGAAGKKAKTK